MRAVGSSPPPPAVAASAAHTQPETRPHRQPKHPPRPKRKARVAEMTMRKAKRPARRLPAPATGMCVRTTTRRSTSSPWRVLSSLRCRRWPSTSHNAMREQPPRHDVDDHRTIKGGVLRRPAPSGPAPPAGPSRSRPAGTSQSGAAARTARSPVTTHPSRPRPSRPAETAQIVRQLSPRSDSGDGSLRK